MIDVAICSGRFNPPTDGHYRVFQKLNNVVMNNKLRGEVFIVDGIGASTNVEKNPLSIDERRKIIKRWFPTLHVDFVTTPYELFDIMTVQNKRMVQWFIGEDRKKAYTALLKQHGLGPEILKILARSEEDVSATKARKASIDGDIHAFSKMMPSVNTLEDNLFVMNTIRGKNNLCPMTLPTLQLLK